MIRKFQVNDVASILATNNLTFNVHVSFLRVTCHILVVKYIDDFCLSQCKIEWTTEWLDNSAGVHDWTIDKNELHNHQHFGHIIRIIFPFSNLSIIIEIHISNV